MVAALPLAAARALGRGLGSVAYQVARRHRVEVLAEMARCFPGEEPAALKARLRRVYRNLGVNAMELLRWVSGGREELESTIRTQGFEHVETVLARGRGGLVLTAHVGNFDLLGLWAARRYPLTIISKSLRQGGANRFWMEAREASGLKILPRKNSYRACRSVLKKNEVLGFILDQNMRREQGVFVDFFGKSACTTPGLAFLSAHGQAPVLPVFLVREADGSQTALFLPPVEPPAARDEKAILEATQVYTRIIEDVIRQHPDQWIWMHRRWRTRPESGERPGAAAGPMPTEE